MTRNEILDVIGPVGSTERLKAIATMGGTSAEAAERLLFKRGELEYKGYNIKQSCEWGQKLMGNVEFFIPGEVSGFANTLDDAKEQIDEYINENE